VFDCPIHRASKDIPFVVVHPEHEAAIDHDAEAVQPFGDSGVIAAEILPFIAAGEIAGGERFESHEETSKSSGRRALDQIAAENRIDRGRALEQPAHPAHALEQRFAESSVAQQMVVEKIEMPARQPIDFRQRLVHTLRVERAAAVKERVLVTEVAMLRTTPGDDDGVRDEIAAAINEVAADRWDAIKRATGRGAIYGRGMAGTEIGKKLGKRLIAGPEKYGVCVPRCLIRQRRDVQTTQRHERTQSPIPIRQPIRTPGVGDVHLKDNQVRQVRPPLIRLRPSAEASREGGWAVNVLIVDDGLIVRSQIGRERGQAERREQGILDGPEIRAGRLGQRGQHEPHTQRALHG